jgi:hypothetical protein
MLKQSWFGIIKAALKEIAILGTAGLLASFCYVEGTQLVTTWRHNHASNASARGVVDLAVGGPAAIEGVQFTAEPLTLVLVASPKCHFCLESAEFHRSLISQAKRQRVPVYIAVPDRVSGEEYVSSIGETYARSKEWRDLKFRFPGTPTLLLVDSKGIAKRVWIGRLSPGEDEETVLGLLASGQVDGGKAHLTVSSGPYLTGAAFAEQYRQHKVALIDPRQREQFAQGHDQNAINIPIEELAVRATMELNESLLQVVDCSNVTQTACKAAISAIEHEGFRATALNAGALTRSCRVTTEK